MSSSESPVDGAAPSSPAVSEVSTFRDFTPELRTDAPPMSSRVPGDSDPAQAVREQFDAFEAALEDGDLSAARRALKKADAFAKRADLVNGRIAVRVELGKLAAKNGHHDQAQTHFETALSLIENAGGHPGLGRVLRLLGVEVAHLGDIDRAISLTAEALDVLPEEEARERGVTLYQFAVFTQRDEEGQDHARAALEEARSIFRNLGDHDFSSTLGMTLSSLAAKKEDFDAAYQHAAEVYADVKAHDVSDDENLAHSALTAGLMATRRRDRRNTRRYLRYAVDHFQKMGDLASVATTLATGGIMAFKAFDRSREALALLCVGEVLISEHGTDEQWDRIDDWLSYVEDHIGMSVSTYNRFRKRALDSYQDDGGRTLLAKAFKTA